MIKKHFYIIFIFLLIFLIISVIFNFFQRGEIKSLTEKLKEQREEIESLTEKLKEIELKKKLAAESYRKIVIVDFYFSPRYFVGGIDLEWIELRNPTEYTFQWVEYEFYDANDNVVKIRDYLGPLYPYSQRKFYINKWCEGLWEHKYGVRIVNGKVVE